MADLGIYHSAVRVQTRQVFMAVYAHPFLLLKLEEAAAVATNPPAQEQVPPEDDDWGSHTRISTGIGKTGSFSVLRHNAALYQVFPLKKTARAVQVTLPVAAEALPQAPEAAAVVAGNKQQAKEPTQVLVSIGRQASNDIVVADPAISKHHADFGLWSHGDITLTDKGSRNGTSVGGRRLHPETPVPVSFGDPIVMGGLAFIIIGAGALWEIIHAQLADAARP